MTRTPNTLTQPSTIHLLDLIVVTDYARLAVNLVIVDVVAEKVRLVIEAITLAFYISKSAEDNGNLKTIHTGLPGACETVDIALMTLPSRVTGLVAVGALDPAFVARFRADTSEKGDQAGMFVLVQLGRDYDLPDRDYDAVCTLRDDGVVMLGGEPDLFRVPLIFSGFSGRAGGLLLVRGYNPSEGRPRTCRRLCCEDSRGGTPRSFAPNLERAPWGRTQRRCGFPSRHALRVSLAGGRGLVASQGDLGRLARLTSVFCYRGQSQ